jgi:NAD(P)H-hydrate repair Nnr-like enzyme with NAD(P)H-hydrate dehydratase domain
MGCVALLKGATSVICGEHTYLSASGTPAWQSRIGRRADGMIGALLAQGLSPGDA